jgi:chorismate mutase
MVPAIRGATQIDADEHNSITKGPCELVAKVLARNQLSTGNVNSVISVCGAVALRTGRTP